MAITTLVVGRKITNLTIALADLLRQEISDGVFKVGDKLPSSKDIEQQAGVSRSVVREAIAQLKAEGLVVSQRGAGVFVKTNIKRGFDIAPTEFDDYQNAIHILELRMGIEVEMAGMAARNRTERHIQQIFACIVAMEQKIAKNQNSVKEDFAFHSAIATASGNPFFRRFIDFIGSGVIPARSIITKYENSAGEQILLADIQKEHRRIFEAIELRDSELAKAASKAHIVNSINRHKKVQKNYMSE